MPDTELDAPSKDQLLAMSAAHDRGENIDEMVAKPAADVPAPEKASDAKPEDKPEPDTPKEAPEEKAVSKEAKTEEPKKPEAKPENKSKYAQNEERKAKTWQEINAEKEAIRAEKEAIAREREAIAAAKRPAFGEAVKDEHGFTAKDYVKVAEEYRKKGDQATADAATAIANGLLQREQAEMQQQQVRALQSAHDKVFAEESEKHPELKDPNSEFYRNAQQAFEAFPMIKNDPNGIKYAVRYAEIQKQAKEFEGTKAEYTKLKEDYSKLQKKLSISGGSPTGAPAEEKPFSKMTLAEERQYLERAAAQSDRENGLD